MTDREYLQQRKNAALQVGDKFTVEGCIDDNGKLKEYTVSGICTEAASDESVERFIEDIFFRGNQWPLAVVQKHLTEKERAEVIEDRPVLKVDIINKSLRMLSIQVPEEPKKETIEQVLLRELAK